MKRKFHPVWDGGHFVGGSVENGKPLGARFERRIVGLAHWCPGCGKFHVLRKSEYQFSGEPETPTVQPACIFPIILDSKNGNRSQAYHCVYTITDGKIYFGRECTHRLAGQVVDMPSWRVQDANAPVIPGALTA